ncbi:unnamed protein product [Caenorhabditis bovis]|uniref:Uncharacterized protein n=1 Tax=Caenorhabditis bovis TaxID=2654633 RepID=A0A8S1F3D5_9PELO|nr:unnamed protein product [Caenorhabditis bovis]
MTPSLAGEIIHLAAQYRSKMLKYLRKSVEKHCIEELKCNFEDLEYVVQMLMTAQEALFSDLQSCCTAAIISYHFKQFLEVYLNSLKIKRDFLRSACVQCSVSKLPAICQ